MKLVQIIFLVGTHCISPVEHVQGLSEVHKVPCAIIVNRDTDSGAVTTEPPGLAALPEVAAALDPAPAGSAAVPRPFMVAEKSQPVQHPHPQQQVRIVPVSDTAQQNAPGEMAATGRVEQATPKPPERRHARALPDRCGSYKAIWYTAKSGARRYRCVRQG